MRSKHVSRIISAPPDTVYAFACDPANLPRWASGLATSDVTRRDDDLVVLSPMGEVVVRFAPRNDFGVLDHDVTLPSGEVVTNPLRVFAHPHGAEIVFTVRQIGLSDAEFRRDCATVAKDLTALADLVEN